jgi:hypothetical protein
LRTAQFSGKANVIELVNGVEQSIEGNCVLQLELREIDFINGVGDQMSVTINRNKGGLWFSSSWNGTKSVLKEIEAGSNISIYYGASTTPTMVTNGNTAERQSMVSTLGASVAPNPTQNYSNIKLESSNTREPIVVRVTDQFGRTIEVKKGLSAGQTIQLGAGYKVGMYFVELIQGEERRQVKLIKQ